MKKKTCFFSRNNPNIFSLKNKQTFYGFSWKSYIWSRILREICYALVMKKLSKSNWDFPVGRHQLATKAFKKKNVYVEGMISLSFFKYGEILSTSEQFSTNNVQLSFYFFYSCLKSTFFCNLMSSQYVHESYYLNTTCQKHCFSTIKNSPRPPQIRSSSLKT